jgi:hypothetical protein
MPRHYHYVDSGGYKEFYLLRYNALLAACFTATLKMEATYSSEMSVDFHRTIRRYIPELFLVVIIIGIIIITLIIIIIIFVSCGSVVG